MSPSQYAAHRTAAGNKITQQGLTRYLARLQAAGAATRRGSFWNIDAVKADAVLAGVDPTKGKPLTGNTGGRPPGTGPMHRAPNRSASARVDGARLEASGGDLQIKAASMLLAGRAAKAHIDAENAKLDLSRKQGSLLDRAQVKAAWDSAVSQVKTTLLNIPDQLCDYIAPETDPVTCREMMHAKIWEALNGLSRGEIAG